MNSPDTVSNDLPRSEDRFAPQSAQLTVHTSDS